MKLPIQYVPEACVASSSFAGTATETSHSHVAHVYLDTGAKRLVATDGTVVVIIPCDVDKGDKSGPIPVDAIAIARSTARAAELTELTIECGKDNLDVIGPDGCVASFARPECTDKPMDWATRLKSTSTKGLEMDATCGVAIDVGAAKKVARALGVTHLIVINTQESIPLKVTAEDAPDCVALIAKKKSTEKRAKPSKKGKQAELPIDKAGSEDEEEGE